MTKDELVKKLHANLELAKNERLSVKNDPSLALAKQTLKTFQIARLKTTHADFLNSPDTQKATNFFLKELYGTKDLGQRDKDLAKLIPMMEKIFPLNALEVITNAIALDALTEVLDNKLAKTLGSNFTEAQYSKAYRECTAKDERVEQINLTESLGHALIDLVNLPFLNTTLKMMKVPARLANLQDMHKFLEEGFMTFKETKNAHFFIKELIDRERKLLDEIFTTKKVSKKGIN